ncbi:MAG: asparagine synthase (glutamine-hydrolyzing) [Hyphomicrobium sp.]
MCGFAGFLTPGGLNGSTQSTARAMAAAIRHRGPDDEGIWTDAEAGIALCHRRLSIIDLSPAGHQPMLSDSGRHVFAFNGEIYNHRDLRADLERQGRAPVWRGHSDTETLLEAMAAWGVGRTLQAAAGMFAFALWDREMRSLVLARDRLGEKPLYYGWSGGTLLFGSELAALVRHPAWQGDIDRDALALMMRFNNVPAPHSIYRGIGKLTPGTFVTLSSDAREAVTTTYWSAETVARDGLRSPFRGSPADASTEVERLVRQSLAGQMVADVPHGAFLSGGIDSTGVVALMQEMSPTPVKTFTIGFSQAGYDEATHARAVARHLGTDHHELYVSAEEARAVIPDLPALYSEPFADSSQIPTFLVARMARRHVTVSLSGDGGDEVFCGYRRYQFAADVWPRLRRLPLGLRAGTAGMIRRVKPQHWDALAGRSRLAGDRLHKAARVLALDDADAAYRALVSHWDEPEKLVIGSRVPPSADLATLGDATRQMMLRDMLGYLPDDILVKVDRASMAVGLEARVPYLDHRLVEFAWTLPLSILRHAGRSKWPLRDIIDRRLPPGIMDRPKSGFAVPLTAWLTGPLRDWAESLLAEQRLTREGYFQPAPIRAAWDALLSGRAANQERVWNVLMFQCWHDAQRSSVATPATPRPAARAGTG